jgi:nucleoside-diphosphate-sugar epimerase
MGIELVNQLLSAGHEVVTFNRGTRRPAWHRHVETLIGDRNQPAAVAPLARRAYDAIIDLAAYTTAQTELLLSVAGHVERFVHVSTGAVYEPQPILPWPEETPYGPWSLWGEYAVQKLGCEDALRERRPADTATTVLRFPYVLGPRNYSDREEFVLNRLLDRQEVLIPGDGKAVQQFLSAAQAAFAMVAAVQSSATPGFRPFNVASSELASLEGFVCACAEVAGVEPRYRTVGGGPNGTGLDVFVGSNYLFPFPNENYVLDLGRSERAGLAPPFEGLKDMIAAALEALLADPSRRRWARTDAERLAGLA